MKNFICFVIGILVGVVGYRVYTNYQEFSEKINVDDQELTEKITVDDIVGTYTDYNPQFTYGEPNPIGFPEDEWVIVITKLSETEFMVDGSISTTGEVDNGKINVHPTKYKNGAEHIDINYTLGESDSGLFMWVKCVGEALSKNKLKLYDEIIYLDLRKVADYDYRMK